VAANFPDGPGGGSVTLPHSFALGVGWAADNWKVELSGNLTLWNSFEELRINFESGRPTPSSASPRDWTPVPTIRVGGEYTIAGHYALRLGAAYDFNPAPDETLDPSLPDQDRFIYTAGVGYERDWFGADIGYMGLFLPQRDITATNVNFGSPPDFYESRFIHVLGLTLSFMIEPSEDAPETTPADPATPETAELSML
jgi:long-chain fatty acid transport protein